MPATLMVSRVNASSCRADEVLGGKVTWISHQMWSGLGV
jgi:hypothetical protein